MRWIVVALVMTGCVTMDPRHVAQNRRDMTAPVIGCAPVDTIVPVTGPDVYTWTATCRGGRTFACRGEVMGGVYQRFAVICDPTD